MTIFSDLAPRDWLSLAGIVLEIIGIIMMANSYLGAAKRRHWLPVLLSALVRGKQARGAVAARDINEDDGLLALQGLGLIALGFVSQALAILILEG
jgi:hypothetical protein